MTEIQIRSDEIYVRGSKQEILREYDDVILLRSVACEPGNVSADIVPVGTRATIITIVKDEDHVQLECYLNSGGFVFAREQGKYLQLHKSREDKLKNA